MAGQRNWISLWGPFRLQPSEIAKLTLIVWGSVVLSKQIRSKITTWQNLLVPVFPVGAIIAVLVIFEGDLGTALILGPKEALLQCLSSFLAECSRLSHC